MRLSVPSSSWHSLESLCRSRRNKRRSDSLQATTSVLRGVAGPNQWQTPLQLQQLYVQLVPQQQTCKALQRRCVLQLAALIPMQYLMCCERSRAATTDTAVIEQPVGQQVLLGLASGLIGCDGNYLPFVSGQSLIEQYGIPPTRSWCIKPLPPVSGLYPSPSATGRCVFKAYTAVRLQRTSQCLCMVHHAVGAWAASCGNLPLTLKLSVVGAFSRSFTTVQVYHSSI